MAGDEDKTERNVPAVSGDDVHHLDKSALKEIYEKLLKSKGGKWGPCNWCGDEAEGFGLAPSVYTSVVFSLPDDQHVQNKVSPEVCLQCRNCGNRLFFSLYHLGYDTKGGNKKNG